MTETVKETLISGTATLKEAGIEAPELETEFLLTYLLDIKRHELFLNPDRLLTEEQSELFRSHIARRRTKEPSQYITGMTEFMGLPIKVNASTLIPRPETELIVEEVLKISEQESHHAVPYRPCILDLCTGSGCIAVAIAVQLPGSRIIATDISQEALVVAKENAESNNVSKRIELLRGDLFTALGKKRPPEGFDFILSNPPYIVTDELTGLQNEVVEHEPVTALNGGTDGLDFIRRIITEAPCYLKPGGRLIMEIGYDQSDSVTALLKSIDRFADFTIKKDLSGIERMVVAIAG